MKNSIRSRLLINFVFIVVITLILIDLVLLFTFYQYTYGGMKYILNSRMDSSLSFYKQYIKENNIEKIVAEDSDLLWAQSNIQVQIINKDSEVIYDSIAAIGDPVSNYKDVTRALDGERSIEVRSVNYTEEPVMSVSAPLINASNKIIGVLRYTTSLESVNFLIYRFAMYLIFVSLIIVLLSVIFSHIFAKTIVTPIEEIRDGALLMADGHYKHRIEPKWDDELGELAEALNTLSKEIVQKDQVKNDFISSISHELRTPLTSIKGWAVVLKDVGPEERELILEGLNIIENESDRLSKMVEELLDFSRYISGRITLEKDLFDITETCNIVVRQLMPKAKNESLDLRAEIKQKSVVMVGDENRIKQLLINIVDNAIKFTDPGGWVLLEAEAKGDNYEIVVSDNGVGISQEELTLVKEKFYKGKHSQSHSGLGLSIAEEIAKLHNGKIDIDSKLDVGTTIRIILPITEVVTS